jgi:hypothetical protein
MAAVPIGATAPFELCSSELCVRKTPGLLPWMVKRLQAFATNQFSISF